MRNNVSGDISGQVSNMVSYLRAIPGVTDWIQEANGAVREITLEDVNAVTDEIRIIEPSGKEEDLVLKAERSIINPRMGNWSRVYIMHRALLDRAYKLANRVHNRRNDYCDVYMAGAKNGIIRIMEPLKRDGGCRWMPEFEQETLTNMMVKMMTRGYDCVGFIRLFKGNKITSGMPLGPVLHQMSSNAPGFFMLTFGVDGVDVATREVSGDKLISQFLLILDKNKVYMLPRQYTGLLKDQFINLVELRGGVKNVSYQTFLNKSKSGN